MADVVRHRGGGVTRAEGRWRARLNVGTTRIALGCYATREEAEAAVEAARLAVEGGAKIIGASTLREWGAEWLKRREEGGRIAGISEERSSWETHVAPHPIADLPLRSITRVHIVRWLDHLAHDARALQTVRRKTGTVAVRTDRRLGRQTLVHALRILRGVLEGAVDAGQVASNVAAGVKVPRGRAEETTGDGASWTWLRPDEIATVLGAERAPTGRRLPERHRLCWTVAIYTGLRRGELRDLAWQDVDLEADVLIVRRPKSRKTREVPLLPPARRALVRLRELAPGIGTAAVWRPARRRPSEPDVGRMGRDWDLWWRAHGPGLIGRHVRPHDLRHTCASHLIQGTWGRTLSLSEVRDWMGHASTRVTERYAHLAPEGLRGIAAEMAEGWGEDG